MLIDDLAFENFYLVDYAILFHVMLERHRIFIHELVARQTGQITHAIIRATSAMLMSPPTMRVVVGLVSLTHRIVTRWQRIQAMQSIAACLPLNSFPQVVGTIAIATRARLR